MIFLVLKNNLEAKMITLKKLFWMTVLKFLERKKEMKRKSWGNLKKNKNSFFWKKSIFFLWEYTTKNCTCSQVLPNLKTEDGSFEEIEGKITVDLDGVSQRG